MNVELSPRDEALVRMLARRLVGPSDHRWDDVLQEGRIAVWQGRRTLVGERMVDWLRMESRQRVRLGGDGSYFEMTRSKRTKGSRDAHVPRVPPTSLDVPAAEDVEETVGESLADDALGPADVVCARDELRRLPDRERAMAVMCGGGWTGREVGEHWGVTRARACQVRRDMRDRLEAA